VSGHTPSLFPLGLGLFVSRLHRRLTVALIPAALLASGHSSAQELEPRTYSPSPIRTSLVIVGTARSEGALFFDSTSPVTDAHTQLDSLTVGYGTSVAVLGRATNFAIAAPYIWGHTEGNVGELGVRSVSRSGLGDMRLHVSARFVGGEALTPEEFVRQRPRTVFGASLTIIAPTGQYDSSRLVNIGSNRWAVKPEIGVSVPYGRCLIEGSLGAWLFQDNDEYFGDRVRGQEPLGSVQVHVSYLFRPRLWLALSGTYFRGGRTSIDGIWRDDRQANSRIGMALSLPIGNHQSIKLIYSTGMSTQYGGDFDNYGVFWSYGWTG
jgi:Putative MetA-pathway of phenol degradation